MLNCLESFQGKRAVPLKQFQRLLGHMASTATVTPLGLLHVRALQHWFHNRVPRWAWRCGTYQVSVTPSCRQTFCPWSNLAFLRAGVLLVRVSRHVIINICFCHGLGSHVQRACSCRALDRAAVAYQLPRVASSMACSAPLQTTATRQACTGLYGQHCDHCIYHRTSIPLRKDLLWLLQDQLFVCFGGQQKGKAVSKQRLAHWIVETIVSAYQAWHFPRSIGVRAQSTRGVSSSWALAQGTSIADICRAAGWATPNSFARFYSSLCRAHVLPCSCLRWPVALGPARCQSRLLRHSPLRTGYVRIYCFSVQFPSANPVEVLPALSAIRHG